MTLSEMKQYRKTYHDELFNSFIPFWTNNAIDPVHGGVYTCLDRTGKMYSTDKSGWFQGRCAWTYAHLCNVYGHRDEWLQIAKNCLDFSEKHLIDADGRMFFAVTEAGRPLRKRRYMATEAFYVLGNAEYAIATGDTAARDNAKKYFRFMTDMYDDAAADPFKIHPKVYPETRPMRGLGSPMILIDLCDTMRRADPENAMWYGKRSAGFVDDIMRYHYKEDIEALLENVGPNGEFLWECSAGRHINPGHDLEACWFMLREAIRVGNDTLIQAAKKIYDWSMRRGWDTEYGGLLYFVDAFRYPPEPYEHDMKLWWPQNEAIIASLMLYQHTKDECYAKDFKRIHDYTFSHFPDREYGEWYGYLRRDGKPTEPAPKGTMYKGPFHIARMLMQVEGIFAEMEKTIESN